MADRARFPSLREVLRGARVRILVWYVVLLAASSLVSALVAFQVLSSRLADEIETGLTQEAQELDQLASGNNPPPDSLSVRK